MSCRGSGEGSLALPADVQRDLVSAPRRSRLPCILSTKGPTSILDLAVAIRANERGVEATAVSQAECEAVTLDIFERLLPKLTATEVVEFDSVMGKVRLEEPAIVPLAKQALAEDDVNRLGEFR